MIYYFFKYLFSKFECWFYFFLVKLYFFLVSYLFMFKEKLFLYGAGFVRECVLEAERVLYIKLENMFRLRVIIFFSLIVIILF